MVKLSISAPVNLQGPCNSTKISSGPSSTTLNLTSFKFKIMSAISSKTPLIEVNSWDTPSILMDVIAPPGIEVRSERLNVLPIVTPYPLSKGSAITFA